LQTKYNIWVIFFKYLCFFIDGTAIDWVGQHTQTPVMFTLGIFKQCLRNQSKASHNVGFIKNNTKQQYSCQQIRNATKNKKYPKTHECYVPDNHNYFHAQLQYILNDLLRLQQHQRGIKWVFTMDGVEQSMECLFFPIIFFARDTMECNKMCYLWGDSSHVTCVSQTWTIQIMWQLIN